MSVPPPVIGLVALVALVLLVLLWKVLATAGLIGLTQWAVITQAENPAVVVLVLGVPALVTAALLLRLVTRPALATHRPLRRLR